MGHSVEEGVSLARSGDHPALVCRVRSGWVVLADMQYLSGYSILLADPVVSSLNDLEAAQQADFLLDMARVGSALLNATVAQRINYGIMCNTDPHLHAHIVPRYAGEPIEMLHNHPWAYPDEIMSHRLFDPDQDSELIRKLREAIQNL